ncbi:MAG: 16S rRNA (cytidine(1402)-2'-O)-methyltransferase [Ruminococcaceae bacterium]|nr:16S rRNA (cytidine(1402)-2'-O)-methyltransferase [Oscillospiraceae bacterium]
MEKGALYVAATPIGNLSDITERAKKVLCEVDFVAAEDTRVSGLLLSKFNIKKSIVNYFEHNKREAGEKIIEELLSGKSCALVTDAGTPAISDPGTELCELAHKNGIKVIPIPGACAAISALCASGFDSRRFIFEGFLPQDNTKDEVLTSLVNEKRTVIFYEAPHRLKKTLSEMYEALGERNICLARELTKINEEFVITTFSEALLMYDEKDPRGEYVIIVGGKTKEEENFWEKLTIVAHVDFYIDKGLSKMDAIKACAKDRGVPKNAIYKEML